MRMPPAIRLMRPKQWIKNGFIFAPLFFAHQFTHPASWGLTLIAVAAFVLLSSAVYVGNDIKDIAEDKLHPVKSKRPLASGDMSVGSAIALGIGLVAAALAVLAILPPACGIIAAIYVCLNVVYTLWLKKLALLDIFFIAMCYVLRVLMGCAALSVTVSSWIILTTFLLALFLGFGKRYNEMAIPDYVKIKPNLKQYSRELLDRLVIICGGGALMSYAIYTTEMARALGHVEMVYTVGFVAFGLFRYLQCVYVHGQGGEPELVILKDKLQLLNIALWLICTLYILF